MDLELQRGFQQLQSQVFETRAKIQHIESCQKVTTHDAKINQALLKDFKDDRFFYQPVGRMLIKREGDDARRYLEHRQKELEDQLKQYDEMKETCTKRVKESEQSLRDLVNKKRNQLQPQEDNAKESKD